MIVVTGAAGFIGSVLVYELNQKSHSDIVVVDHVSGGEQWNNLQFLDFQKFLFADELLKQKDKFWQKVDLVYHLGACSSTTEKNESYLRENNLEYSQKVFKLCTKYKIPLVYASSAATYGDDQKFNDQETELKPLNLYGQSKHLFDLWALEQADQPPLWVGVKFFNVFGPHEYHKGSMRSVVKQAHEQIKKTGTMKLFRSYKEGFAHGEQKRDFIYVRDAAKALIELSQINQSGVYNLGTGKARTFLDLVKAVFSTLKLEEKIEFIAMPEDLINQYQYYTQADLNKLKHVLPQFKFSSLEEAVQDYVENFLEGELYLRGPEWEDPGDK